MAKDACPLTKSKKSKCTSEMSVVDSAAETQEEADVDAMEAKRRRKQAKLAAVAEIVGKGEDEIVDPTEAKKLKKAAKRVAAEASLVGELDEPTKKKKKADQAAETTNPEVAGAVDPIEAKRLRKEAKRAAAAEAQAELDRVEAKRQRKAARREAEEASALEASHEIDPLESKKSKKAAKLAAKEALAVEAQELGTGDGASKTKSQSDQAELTVFVGGIPFRCDADVLRQDFEVCGEIAQMTMPLNHDGRSSGTAFISFKTQEGVQEALKYDGDAYGGRTLTVKVAGKMGERGLARGDSALEVCVKGLPNTAEDSGVRAEFAQCGDIASLRVPRWPDGGCKGMAFITFQTTEGLANALELNDQIKMGSRYLSVQKAQSVGKGKAKGT